MVTMPGTHIRRRELNEAQLILVLFVVTLVSVALVGYGAAASYDNLWHLAVSRHVPLPRLMPVGLDGGLIGTVALDLLLTWIGYPLWWLRATARLFALGTIAANAFAGWPDPLGMFLRVAAPVLIVVITEAIRAVLLKRRREELEDERIPLARWLLAFRSTFALWRRMKLWRITSYADGVELEMRRQQAVEKLKAHYKGKDWRKEAPGTLVWMLGQGLFMGEALGEVEVLTAPPKGEVPPRRPRVNKGKGKGVNRVPRPGGNHEDDSPRDETTVPPDISTQAEALKILAAEPDISGKELGRRLGKTERYGGILKNKLAPVGGGPGE